MRANGVEPEIIDYLAEELTAGQWAKIIKTTGMKPAELLRKKEAKDGGIDPAGSDKAIIEGIARYPKAIERPIVVSGAKGVLARPAEKALEVV